MRRLILVCLLALLATPAAADMFQDGSNARLPEARYNIGSNDACNPVADFKADATGASDAAPAINQCAAVTRNGERVNVYLPAGTYLVRDAIALDSQCLIGSSRQNTTLLVEPGISAAALGVITLAGRENKAACVQGLTIKFLQPPDVATTAAAPSASGATTIQVASTTNVAVGDYAWDRTAAHNSIRWVTKVTNIAGTTLTLDRPIGSVPVAAGDQLLFSAPRTDFKTLAEGCTVTAGGSGCKYPAAIRSVSANRFQVHDVNIYGAWQGIDASTTTGAIGGTDLSHLDIGALDYGIFLDNAFDAVRLSNLHCWAFGFPTGQASGAYMDGALSCLKLGRVDGLVASNIISWQGNISTVPNAATSQDDWHFGSVVVDGGSIFMDDAFSAHFTNLNVVEAQEAPGRPLLRVGGASRVYLTSASIGANSIVDPPIVQAGGNLWVSNSFLSNIGTGPVGIVSVTGGNAVIRTSTLHNPFASNSTAPYVSVSGAGSLELIGNTFSPQTATGTPAGILISADNAGHYIAGNSMYGKFTASLPFMPVSPLLGYYDLGEQLFKFDQTPGSGAIAGAFATPGDSVLTTVGLGGAYQLRGNSIQGSADFTFNTNAYTTAAGRLELSIPQMPLIAAASIGGCNIHLLNNVTIPSLPTCNVITNAAGKAAFEFSRMNSGATRTVVSTAEVPPSKNGVGLRWSWNYSIR